MLKKRVNLISHSLLFVFQFSLRVCSLCMFVPSGGSPPALVASLHVRNLFGKTIARSANAESPGKPPPPGPYKATSTSGAHYVHTHNTRSHGTTRAPPTFPGWGSRLHPSSLCYRPPVSLAVVQIMERHWTLLPEHCNVLHTALFCSW